MPQVIKYTYQLLLCLSLAVPLFQEAAYAQFFRHHDLKAGLKLLEKQEFDKLHKKLEKELKKTPNQVVANYLYGLFYFDSLNPRFQIDSAYRFSVKAIMCQLSLSPEEAKKLSEREGITAEMLTRQKQQIEAFAFEETLKLASEKSFQLFIDRFSSAIQVSDAQFKRDSIGFETASAENTYQSYDRFLKKYPNAPQKDVALDRYHRLLYLQKTKYQSVESFADFIRDHPESPFRYEAEKQLFYNYTYDNHLKTYENFVRKFPDNTFAYMAWEWIWHLNNQKETFLQKYPEFPKPAEVAEKALREKELYFPFLEGQSIGFMNHKGEVRITPNYVSVPDDYLCDGAYTDFLVVQKGESLGAIDKLGNEILPYEYDEITDFGPGVLKVKKKGHTGLHHKGGFALVANQYQELQYIDNSLVMAKKDGKWGIITYYDSLVYPFKLESIAVSKGGLLILEKYNRFAFIHAEELLEASQRKLHPEYGSLINFQVETYELVHDNYLKYQREGKWGVMTLFGREIIPARQDQIEESRHGWVLSSGKRKYLYTTSGNPVSPLGFDQVLTGKKAYGVKRDSLWGVMDLEGKFFIQPLYDTLFFIDEKGILLERGNKKFGYFYTNELTDFSAFKKLNVQSTLLFQETDTVAAVAQTFIITEDIRGRKGLLANDGSVIIKNRYDHITLMDDGVAMVGTKEKRGIMDMNGKLLLPIAYTGIAKYDKGFFSILGANKKFGAFHPHKNILISPQYDALLKLYGNSDSLFIAKKGMFGLVNKDEKVVAPFQFEELRHWNDSVILVQNAGKWKLFQFRKKYYLPETFDTFRYLKNDADEKVIITFRSSGHGLLSSKKGRIMPEEYTEIRNLTDWKNPLYLAEKHMSQANLYILLHIDQYGQVVKEQTVKDADYNRIVCQD